MNYISLDNLTRYHRNFRDYGDARYALTRGSLWKQTEKAGAVTCWPVGESRMKPVVEFMFKETLPEGTKGPGNPSVIVPTPSITLARCGKNLLKYPYSSGSKTESGVTFTMSSDSSVLINGTASSDIYYYPAYVSYSPILVQGRRYAISGCPAGGSPSTYYFRYFDYTGTGEYDIGNGGTFIAKASGRIGNAALLIRSGTTATNLVFKPQLELGSVATSFEPYAGADYAIDLGSTFYGGTLDVASGKLTVTHRMVEADSLTLDISNYPAYLPLECTDTFGRTITSTGNILALTGSTGGKIVYKLANPYTVQIDPVVITALPQIDKYTPRLNTLYTDAENITVGYIKSPIRDEYEKVQAIIANGGTI